MYIYILHRVVSPEKHTRGAQRVPATLDEALSHRMYSVKDFQKLPPPLKTVIFIVLISKSEP